MKSESMLKDFESEVVATRKCLERISGDTFSWKPHEKSMTMGYLSLLVAEIPRWIAVIINDGSIDFKTFTHPEIKNTEELVKYFDDNLAAARAALQGLTDEKCAEPFYLKNGGQVLITSTKGDMIGPATRHWVHHRGQLTVFMRLKGIPVPSIYGPSADEQGF